jgi:hypothetical protein
MTDRTINLIGWALFIGSALAFVIASWGDFWSSVGSFLFLIACLIFLIPFAREHRSADCAGRVPRTGHPTSGPHRTRQQSK